jgi:hypothetical protein
LLVAQCKTANTLSGQEQAQQYTDGGMGQPQQRPKRGHVRILQWHQQHTKYVV